jgi:hypothetical protein
VTRTNGDENKESRPNPTEPESQNGIGYLA